MLHLKVDPAVLRQRLHDRAERFDANPDNRGYFCIFDFEEPRGQGETVIPVGKPW